VVVPLGHVARRIAPKADESKQRIFAPASHLTFPLRIDYVPQELGHALLLSPCLGRRPPVLGFFQQDLRSDHLRGLFARTEELHHTSTPYIMFLAPSSPAREA